MTKRLELKDIYLGQLIVRTEHEEAQVYTVGAISKLAIYLVWFEGTRKFGQWSDYSGSHKPTLKQIERSIAINGRLASSTDITSLNVV